MKTCNLFQARIKAKKIHCVVSITMVKTINNRSKKTIIVINKKDYLKWTSKPCYVPQKIFDIIFDKKYTLKIN